MYSELYGFARMYLFPDGDVIRQNLRELEHTQWISREELEAIQLKKIQNLVAYAYEHVPFYGKWYHQEGIHPQDIKSFKDFKALPFLTRDDVINNLESLVATGYHGKVFEDKTGGSTGRPMHFFMDQSTALWSAAIETRHRGWYGVKFGDKRAWVWGNLKDFPSWKKKDRLAAYIKRYRYLNAHTLTEQNMDSFAAILEKWKPAMFRAYPSALYIFAQYIKDKNRFSIRPKLIETSGEKLSEIQKNTIAEVFSAPIAEHYSSWEIYSIAYHCPQGGYHVSEDRYLEIVDDAGNQVENGNIGEVVVTSLNQYAMPFIRYKNEDCAIYETKNCNCGRSMPTLREVVGRFQDLLMRPDGQIVYGSIVDYLTHDKPEVKQFQVYQKDKYNLEVRLVLKCKINKDWESRFIKELEEFFSSDMKIKIQIVDEIKLTEAGKLRTVISDIHAVL
ncbi:MAG: hypothetical protein CVU51_01235 [Deltaproteobacteria bacterium HGW-Deltaproteobacteria-1]|nr:MAG: hypothetical protein CVU51_01235 [Deltaproteobacteria bacterium HGW-Deltaproteobacteria-1]